MYLLTWTFQLTAGHRSCKRLMFSVKVQCINDGDFDSGTLADSFDGIRITGGWNFDWCFCFFSHWQLLWATLEDWWCWLRFEWSWMSQAFPISIESDILDKTWYTNYASKCPNCWYSSPHNLLATIGSWSHKKQRTVTCNDSIWTNCQLM